MKSKKEIKERLKILEDELYKEYNSKEIDKINAGIRTLKWVLEITPFQRVKNKTTKKELCQI